MYVGDCFARKELARNDRLRLDDLDLFVSEAVELIDKGVDLAVGGLYVAGEALLFLRGSRGAFVQLEHYKETKNSY